MARRNYSNTASVGTIGDVLNNTDSTTTVNLTTGALTGWPSTPASATINLGSTTDEEVVLVTSISGTQATLTRGYNGSAVRAHTAGATLTHTSIAQDFDEANSHVNATTGVHGAVGSIVGTTGAQTLDSKTLLQPVIADFTNAQHDHSSGLEGGGIPITSVASLQPTLNGKADDSAVVHKTGTETVAGDKTFSNNVSAASITGTALARGTSKVWALDNMVAGTFSGATDASSYCTVSGLPFAPSWVSVTLITPSGGANTGFPVVVNTTSDGFRIRVMLVQGNVNSISISGYYFAAKA